MSHRILSVCARVLVISSLALSCHAATADGDGHGVKHLTSAYAKGFADGRYAKHLKPYVLPTLLPRLSENIFITDRDKGSSGEITGHVLRQVSEKELDQIRRFFDMPVMPTHILEIQSVEVDGATTMTSKAPLFVKSAPGGYHLVLAFPLDQKALASERSNESLRYYKDDGIWQHHWDLQMQADSQYRYSLQVIDSNGNILEELISATEFVFHQDHKTIRFHLHAKGDDLPYYQEPAGDWRVPYAHQVGSRAASDSFVIKSQIEGFVVNENPTFSNHELSVFHLRTVDGPVHVRLKRWE